MTDKINLNEWYKLNKIRIPNRFFYIDSNGPNVRVIDKKTKNFYMFDKTEVNVSEYAVYLRSLAKISMYSFTSQKHLIIGVKQFLNIIKMKSLTGKKINKKPKKKNKA